MKKLTDKAELAMCVSVSVFCALVLCVAVVFGA